MSKNEDCGESNDEAPRKTRREGVGYKKPPVEHQFPKGNPGGPGRPKGVTGAEGILKKVFNDPVPVTENGKRVKKSMAAAMAKRGQQHLLTGPHTAYFRGLELYDRYGPKPKPRREKPIGDLEALGREVFPIFYGLVTKSLAYRLEKEEGAPVEPLSEDLRDAISGCWEFGVGEDGHITGRKIEDASRNK